MQRSGNKRVHLHIDIARKNVETHTASSMKQ